MIVSPRNENELADCVRTATVEKRTLEIVGHGTKRGLGRTVDAGMVLDLSALSGIVRYEPDELVLTARAATPV
ncbi:MAG TPA: FAD-binding protein, partial [Rhizomicrobium sp.]|nr:FAD-binding protein [Rhizomicrobium sp.]